MNIINVINARVTGQNGNTIFAEKEVFAPKGNGNAVKRFYIVASDVEGSYDVNSHVNIAGRYHLTYQDINGQNAVVINMSQAIAEAATEYDGGNISVTISNAKVVSEVKPTRSGNGVWFSTTYRTGRTLPDNKAEIRRITVFTTPRNGKPISTNQNKNLIGMKWDADVVPKDGNIYINETAYETNVEAAFDPYKQAAMPQQQPAANNGNYQQNNGGYQQQSSANNGNYQQNGGYQQQSPANNGNYQQNGGYQQQSPANNGNYQQNGGYQQPGSAQQGYQQSTPQGYQAPSVQQGLSDADLADFEEVTDEALF